ncbi:PqqD family peptide modification chaperone [Ferrovibrio sp.]|uniref:PqqD family peptide modification chaperone n=1 Tax=Ferrovibrio sp. TaxID=1917215 RepID=UPI003D0D7858
MNEEAATAMFRRTDRILTAAVGEELLMMSAAEGKYFNLNDVGTRIWELLAQPVSVEGLVKALTDEYEVDADTARAQVLEFMVALRTRGLLASADAAPLA